ncbi:MAG: hypothetical protein HYV63_18435 [Candidatus Schekmanbacteria bacterium]|nr:hypothetical protein [Candidatus Schekmanbacteria bacterium]
MVAGPEQGERDRQLVMRAVQTLLRLLAEQRELRLGNLGAWRLLDSGASRGGSRPNELLVGVTLAAGESRTDGEGTDLEPYMLDVLNRPRPGH